MCPEGCTSDLDGEKYVSSEHLYQACRLHFHDKHEAAIKVTDAATGCKAMQIAHESLPSDESSEEWNRVAMAKMLDMNRLKFKSCIHARKVLTEASGRLVEATSDLFWGSGMPLELTRSILLDFWPGKNTVGNILCKLLEEFWLRQDNPKMPKSEIVDIMKVQDKSNEEVEEDGYLQLSKRKASSPLESVKKNTKWT